MATHQERLEWGSWFAVTVQFNEQPAQHRVSVSLFWKRIGPAHGILTGPPIPEADGILTFEGTLRELLDRVGDEVATRFWIDLNPRLRRGEHGSKMFLDRRYAEADVVTCGHCFTGISAEVATWAAGIGLAGRPWQEGGILKVPKLEGPMTLWRTEFSRNFRREWVTTGDFLDPEVLLQAWFEQRGATSCTRLPNRWAGACGESREAAPGKESLPGIGSGRKAGGVARKSNWHPGGLSLGNGGERLSDSGGR